MVDEFQDTNRLQTKLIDLLCADRGMAKEIFFVGDEFQSIYGFRHADVAVFRERREAAEPDVLPLNLNYRSRPEVLAAVNELFREEFGESFQPLTPAAGYGDPVFGTPVELLVTDKASYADSGLHWRRAEARHVARRVRELVDAGAATPGEIVLLFAAGTDAEWFEEELRALDLPTIRMTGRRYFGQQQVVDLLHYLRLLQNRYDDEALLTVLASPFVGVSNDALVLIRSTAERRPIFKGHRAHAAVRPRRGGPAARPRVPAALRAPRRELGEALARAALRAHPRRARLRPGRARAARRRSAATRTCASSRGWPAPTRSSAAPTSRASSGSSPSRMRSARPSATPSPRRRARTPCGCSRSTPPRGSSSRSSSSRTPAASGRARTTSSASPTAASGSRSPTPARPRAWARAPTRPSRRRRTGPRTTSACASTTSR